MKRNMIFCFLLLLPIWGVAQETTLNKIYNYLDASNGIQMQVTYSIGDHRAQAATYYGYGQMFHMDSESIKAWYDGTNLWLYVSDSGEVNLSSPDESDLAEINPLLNLKAINTQEYKIIKGMEGSKSTITAIPRASKEIEWIKVTLKSDGRPWILRIKEKGLDQLVIVEIKSLKQGISHKMQQKDFYRFTKNKLPGIAVIDLR